LATAVLDEQGWNDMKNSAALPRTREVIAHDVTYVLNAPLHEKTKRIVVKNAAWAWTTSLGKYEGCPFWTQAALDQFKAATGKRRAKGLNHEHVVPIEALFQILRTLPDRNQEAVYQCLEKCLQGVVVTTEEHDKLNEKFKKTTPDGFDYRNNSSIRARYEECGIEILEIPPEACT
jgi:hypothetical protein